MKKQLSLLSRLQSFDNRMDAMYKSGLPHPGEGRKLTSKQRNLATERQGLVQGINKRLLGTYERMRESRLKSSAVVPVVNGVCQGCYMVVTKSVVMELRRGEELILCEHCGRILFLMDGNSSCL
jgi:predicted  nucleic acid-binding Zn-ribbon protein